MASSLQVGREYIFHTIDGDALVKIKRITEGPKHPKSRGEYVDWEQISGPRIRFMRGNDFRSPNVEMVSDGKDSADGDS